MPVHPPRPPSRSIGAPQADQLVPSSARLSRVVLGCLRVPGQRVHIQFRHPPAVRLPEPVDRPRVHEHHHARRIRVDCPSIFHRHHRRRLQSVPPQQLPLRHVYHRALQYPGVLPPGPVNRERLRLYGLPLRLRRGFW